MYIYKQIFEPHWVCNIWFNRGLFKGLLVDMVWKSQDEKDAYFQG